MKISIIEPGGLNIELANLFAKNNYEVGYYSEYHEAFPTGQREAIGTGFSGVSRFTNLASCLDYGEVIICPDTHSQQYIDLAIKYGKPWWGANRAEHLEQDRLFAKQIFDKLSMPVGPYISGTGIDDLELVLKRTTDRWLKLPGKYRAIGETRHHYDWHKTKREWWGTFLSDLGPDQGTIKWILEEPIKHIMEVAADQMVVNGQYSTPTLVGIEDKDSAYIGKIMPEVPKPLQPANETLAPFFRSAEAKTFISLEAMLPEKGKPIVTDPCLRTGHPVNSTQLRVYKNLCEYIIKAAVDGKNIPIKPAATYAIALEIKSTELTDSWLEIQFDEKQRHCVHLQCAMKKHDSYYVTPKSFIAATITGIGDTLDAAEKEIHKTLESFSCAGMYYDINSIDKIKTKMKEGCKYGIEF